MRMTILFFVLLMQMGCMPKLEDWYNDSVKLDGDSATDDEEGSDSDTGDFGMDTAITWDDSADTACCFDTDSGMLVDTSGGRDTGNSGLDTACCFDTDSDTGDVTSVDTVDTGSSADDTGDGNDSADTAIVITPGDDTGESIDTGYGGKDSDPSDTDDAPYDTGTGAGGEDTDDSGTDTDNGEDSDSVDTADPADDTDIEDTGEDTAASDTDSAGEDTGESAIPYEAELCWHTDNDGPNCSEWSSGDDCEGCDIGCELDFASSGWTYQLTNEGELIAEIGEAIGEYTEVCGTITVTEGEAVYVSLRTGHDGTLANGGAFELWDDGTYRKIGRWTLDGVDLSTSFHLVESIDETYSYDNLIGVFTP